MSYGLTVGVRTEEELALGIGVGDRKITLIAGSSGTGETIFRAAVSNPTKIAIRKRNPTINTIAESVFRRSSIRS